METAASWGVPNRDWKMSVSVLVLVLVLVLGDFGFAAASLDFFSFPISQSCRLQECGIGFGTLGQF